MPKSPKRKERGSASGAKSGGMALNDSAVELEINHVRRQLMGRAFRQQQTAAAVVYEHEVYREGLKRALDGQRTAWQLKLLNNRDLAHARNTSRSAWRPGLAGPGNRSHPKQINVNPFPGPREWKPPNGFVKPLDGLPVSKKAYTPMGKERIDEFVKQVDWLSKPYGNRAASAGPARKKDD